MGQTTQNQNLRPPQFYSLTFKKFIVSAIEQGRLNKEQARRKYHIGGKTTVLNWCRKYGKLHLVGLKNEITMITEETKHQMLEKRVKLLEQALSDAQLKNEVLETMIELAEETFKIDIRKKSGAKQSK